MKIHRVAAFSRENEGGNPAGVSIADVMPSEAEMLATAKAVGFSETAFLHPYQQGWRVRYFAPEIEVPFCGHATIAAGFVLAELEGLGSYKLYLNEGEIEVTAQKGAQGRSFVSLKSPPTYSNTAPFAYVDRLLRVFGWSTEDLNPNFPVRIASAGAKHIVIVLARREDLASMRYQFDELKSLMAQAKLITVSLLWQSSDKQFYARNPFPPGGVYEDPATGAAAAAFAGYLRDIEWGGANAFEVLQGDDMGEPSRLLVSFQPELGSSITVSGEARYLPA